MLARAHTFTIDGLAGAPCQRRGRRPARPAGVHDRRAWPTRRCARRASGSQPAILNSGFEFPARRITANLAPGDLPKAGPGLDLALACAVLAASGQLPSGAAATSWRCSASSALDGGVRPSHGTLAVAQATPQAGLGGSRWPARGPRRRRSSRASRWRRSSDLTSAVRVLRGGAADPLPRRPREAAPSGQLAAGTRSRGRARAASRGRALVIAAAGGHNMPAERPAGHRQDDARAAACRRFCPPLDAREAIEVMRIHRPRRAARATGSLRAAPLPRAASHRSRPRAWSAARARAAIGEVGAGAQRRAVPRRAVGVLARPALEALRQPLEDGRVAIARARHSAVYPARFMLLAATNPCPCGYAGERERCRCRRPSWHATAGV